MNKIPEIIIEAAQREVDKCTWLMNHIGACCDQLKADGILGKGRDISKEIQLLIERAKSAREFIEFSSTHNLKQAS